MILLSDRNNLFVLLGISYLNERKLGEEYQIKLIFVFLWEREAVKQFLPSDYLLALYSFLFSLYLFCI